MLREADIVVVPVTESSDGTTKSRAADIIGEWCATSKMQRYVLPMQRNREAVMQVYDRMCREVAEWYHPHLVALQVGHTDLISSLPKPLF